MGFQQKPGGAFDGNAALNYRDDFFDNIKPLGDPGKPIFTLVQQQEEENYTFDYDGFAPFWYQSGLIQDMRKREFISRGFIVWPRRAGKTIVSIIYLIEQGIKKAPKTDLTMIQYGLVYPDLTAGKEVAWEDLKKYTQNLPGRKTNEQKACVDFHLPNKNGRFCKIRIRIVGLKNIDSRRGGGFDGIILDERGYLPEGFKKVVNPMILDKVRQPTFMIMIGTPNEESTFWEDYDWMRKEELSGKSEFYTYWSNYDKLRHINDNDYEAEKSNMSPEEFAIELDCKRGVSIGARYYAEELARVEAEGRLREIPWNDQLRKWMVCDIGSTEIDHFAIWIVQMNFTTGRYEWIDYEGIRSADENKVFNWVQSRGHNISQIILPWDGATGLKSVSTLLQEKFPNARVDCLARTKKSERIRNARSLFAMSDFDIRNIGFGWTSLKRYSRKWDKNKRIYSIDPRHDKYSHAADAFTHFGLARKENLLTYPSYMDRYLQRPSNRVNMMKSYEPMLDLAQGKM